MSEEAYGKVALKKMQICEWHERFRDGHVSVNDYLCCGDHQLRTQDLAHYKFIQERCTVNIGMHVKILCCLNDEGTVLKIGTKQPVSFVNATHEHIGHRWSRSIQAQFDGRIIHHSLTAICEPSVWTMWDP
jgi:hypothetical protein